MYNSTGPSEFVNPLTYSVIIRIKSKSRSISISPSSLFLPFLLFNIKFLAKVKLIEMIGQCRLARSWGGICPGQAQSGGNEQPPPGFSQAVALCHFLQLPDRDFVHSMPQAIYILLSVSTLHYPPSSEPIAK